MNVLTNLYSRVFSETNAIEDFVLITAPGKYELNNKVMALLECPDKYHVGIPVFEVSYNSSSVVHDVIYKVETFATIDDKVSKFTTEFYLSNYETLAHTFYGPNISSSNNSIYMSYELIQRDNKIVIYVRVAYNLFKYGLPRRADVNVTSYLKCKYHGRDGGSIIIRAIEN